MRMLKDDTPTLEDPAATKPAPDSVEVTPPAVTFSAPVDSGVQSTYEAWRAEPTPARLQQVVKALKPTMRYSLSAFSANDDPYLLSQANLIAAKAVQKYNPEAGTNLNTWVSNQLMQLGREKRKSNAPVRIPERTQLAARHIFQAELEFIDKHGREPDVGELADYAKMPIRQIAKVRNTFLKMPSQGSMGEQEHFGDNLDFAGEALDYLYHELDHVDRRLLEMRTGYGGEEIADSKTIMAKLKMTPVQMSRRSARLAQRLKAITDVLERANKNE